MKFSVSKGELLSALNRVQTVAERRTTMPILSNVLLKAENSKVRVCATDLEIGIRSDIPVDVVEEGDITIKAKSLLDIVRELPDKYPILLTKKENSRLEIRSNKTVFNLLGLPAEEYPDLSFLNNEDDSNQFIKINGMSIMSMLEKTLFAASNDETRYHLNGVFFETQKNNDKPFLRFVATDSYRLSYVDSYHSFFEERAWGMFEEGVIVPRKGLNELRKLLSEGVEDFLISLKNRMLLIKRDHIFLTMRLIEGKYADYRRIIPTTQVDAIRLNREDFLSSLKRVSLMSSDKSKSVTFIVDKGLLQLNSQNPEVGEANEELSIQYNGEPMKIGFNSKYIIDAISTMDGEDVLLEIKGKQNPGVIRSISENDHINIIMPIRT